MARPIVGRSVPRREGPAKLRGEARYVDDIAPMGCLYGATFRSPIPHGRVKSLSFDPSFPWDGFVVATAKDVPGRNCVSLIEEDQPLLADGLVRHVQEPIALVAHPQRARSYEALARIHAEFEPLPAALTVEEALARKAVLRGKDNIFKDILIEKGAVADAFAAADVVVEGEYRVGRQEHAYIETNGMLAWVERDGTVAVQGSLQCPYYVRQSLCRALDLPPEKVRVIQAATGGGFGGKEDYPSILAGHAALLALKAGRPVKLVYDRAEDMAATTKRHPAVVRHRTGVTRHGRLVAQEIEVVMDGGAYLTLSPVVLSRGALHAAGPYECPNVRIRARAVATHTPPNGAFRGFGAPQTLFAAELHMTKIAHALGMDPLTLRRLNVLKEGSSTPTGQVLSRSVGAAAALERCVARSRYTRRRIEHSRWNRRADVLTWRGIGLALVHHGGGFTGSGEVRLRSRAGVALHEDGTMRVLAASAEMGQGATTTLAQIAAEALGVPYDRIEVETPDTSKVPDSGPTVASRTCMVVGELVRQACARLREDLVRGCGGVPGAPAAWRKAARTLCAGSRRRDYIVEYEKPADIQWDEATYKGDAYGAFSYAAAAVELEVDRLTYEARVKGVTVAAELGKAVHPLLAEGQVLGGLAQGLGYALWEKVAQRDGAMANARLTDYVLPTSLDVPPMAVELLEEPYPRGPYGAKGLGELPMDAAAPAVAAAVFHATGLWIPELPLSPERLLQARLDDPDQHQREEENLPRTAL